MEDLQRLIIRAKDGDSNAYGQIYQLFYKRIYRYCRINVYEDNLAQDICQETFVKAWKALPNFSQKGGGSMQAYLFRIARNLIIDHSRKKKEASLDGYENIQTNENFEEDLDKEDTVFQVKNILNKLTDIDRQIITLRYFEELSIYEVSKVVDINEGALRVRIHRILKKLKDLIKDE